MNKLEDIKLKALLREMKLEKPKANFSVRVMNKIFDENPAFEKIKSERILGKGFWIISILFVALLAVIFVVSNAGLQTESQINNLLPEINNGLSTGYQSFFEKLGMVPLSIAGILIASSVLLFIDRFLSSNSRVFSQTTN
jgi:ABC-type Fe3+ transport system permease subunit